MSPQPTVIGYTLERNRIFFESGELLCRSHAFLPRR